MVGRIGSSHLPPRSPSSSHSSTSSAGDTPGKTPSSTRPDGMPASPNGNPAELQAITSFAQSFMFDQMQKNIGEQKENFAKSHAPDEDDDGG